MIENKNRPSRPTEQQGQGSKCQMNQRVLILSTTDSVPVRPKEVVGRESKVTVEEQVPRVDTIQGT